MAAVVRWFDQPVLCALPMRSVRVTSTSPTIMRVRRFDQLGYETWVSLLKLYADKLINSYVYILLNIFSLPYPYRPNKWGFQLFFINFRCFFYETAKCKHVLHPNRIQRIIFISMIHVIFYLFVLKNIIYLLATSDV